MPDFPALAHVAVTVNDLNRSRPWYQQLFDAAPVLDEDTGPFHHVVWLLGGTLFGIHQHREPSSADAFDELLVHATARIGQPLRAGARAARYRFRGYRPEPRSTLPGVRPKPVARVAGALRERAHGCSSSAPITAVASGSTTAGWQATPAEPSA